MCGSEHTIENNYYQYHNLTAIVTWWPFPLYFVGLLPKHTRIRQIIVYRHHNLPKVFP